MKIAYMPGCSLDSTAWEYNQSTAAVCHQLGIELVELIDWNCCGASSAHSLNEKLGILLPGRNILQAQDMGLDLTTPCAACFNRLKKAQQNLRYMKEEVKNIFGKSYQNQVTVRPLLEIIFKGFKGRETLVERPLTGLKVVPYYGCLWVRPPEIMNFDDPEHPTSLDTILKNLGAEICSWSFKTECCGGSLSLTRGKILRQVVKNLTLMAKEAGAKAIVTACPLCQNNLELRQEKESPLPVFYFTELMGLAFNDDKTSHWWKKHIIDPRGVLKENSLIS